MILGDGRYTNGNRQVDIQLLWAFVQFCKDYGDYHGRSMHIIIIMHDCKHLNICMPLNACVLI